MKFKIRYSILIFLTWVSFSCKLNHQTTVPRNLERIYDPSSSRLHPEFRIYNNSDSSSVIFVLLKTQELLFNQANAENELLSRVKVVYNLYDLDNKQNLVDSSTTTFEFDKKEELNYQIVEIEVKSPTGNKYLLEVITTDLNRKNSHYSFHRIGRGHKINLQDYYYYDKESNEILTYQNIKPKQKFGIKHYNRNLDSVYVSFIKSDFYIPLPPYIEDTLFDNLNNIDTTWVCYLDSIKYENFEKEGIYHFSESRNESSFNNGFVLFNFGEIFPKIRTPQELAKPIKYLGSLDSISSPDSIGKLTKLAVDDFWLDKANNIDKSRELLKAYYNRVMLANKYFTSYKEGWQTDRGMIYIIYGLPDYLFKSGEEERWIYNPQGIGTGIEFSFKYIDAPFTFNHYVLSREKLKVTGWDDAVEMWNKGEVIYFQYGIDETR